MPAARSLPRTTRVTALPCPARYSAAWAAESAPPTTATGSGPQALASSSVAAAGALLAVLFLPAQPIQLARPASPAADEAETAEGAREAATRPQPAAAAR